MNPAFSVLIFTLSSGAGYGMSILLIVLHLLGLEQNIDKQLIMVTGVCALVLITLGLLSSTLHLANPKNAWRAFNRFRTSWLSREGVFALLFYPIFFIYLANVWFYGNQVDPLAISAGLVSALIAVIILFCTGMIYASLKTIRQWHTRLTPVNYIILGLMSGSLCLLAIQSALSNHLSTLMPTIAYALLGLGAFTKLGYFLWIGKPAGATINSATGFTQARVRLLETGHTGDSFLTNEFGYEIAANKLLQLRMLMLVLAFITPTLLLVLSMPIVATLACLAGIFIERWLFFAEARHVVMLYHGQQST